MTFATPSFRLVSHCAVSSCFVWSRFVSSRSVWLRFVPFCFCFVPFSFPLRSFVISYPSVPPVFVPLAFASLRSLSSPVLSFSFGPLSCRRRVLFSGSRRRSNQRNTRFRRHEEGYVVPSAAADVVTPPRPSCRVSDGNPHWRARWGRRGRGASDDSGSYRRVRAEGPSLGFRFLVWRVYVYADTVSHGPYDTTPPQTNLQADFFDNGESGASLENSRRYFPEAAICAGSHP